MKNKIKILMSFVLVFVLMLGFVLTRDNVFAASSTNTLSVSFRGDNANYGHVEYSLDGGSNWISVNENTNGIGLNVTANYFVLRIVPNSGYHVDFAGIEMDWDDMHLTDLGNGNSGLETEEGCSVPSNVESVTLTQVEFAPGEYNPPAPSGNEMAEVNVVISGEEFEYGREDATDIAFGINGGPLKRLSEDEVTYNRSGDKIIGLETDGLIDYNYNYNGESNVTFHFRTQWDDVITELRINGVTYSTPQTKDELEAAFSHRGIAFDVENVPYSDTYEIEVVGRKATPEEKIMGNFSWTYDPNTNEFSDDDKIPHGNLEFVKATYKGNTYTNIEAVNNAGALFEWNDGVKGTNDPTGEAMFPPGTELTLRLIPDPGYQLTEFNLNGFPFETGTEVGEYTFTIQGGNFHLGANFTEEDNIVLHDAKAIKNGAIDVNNSFNNGTAKLELNDVSNLTDERKENFEDTAAKDGYKIDNYVDINLYNSIYKGGKKDSNGNYEAWDTKVENLTDDAEVIIQLEDNMKGKDIEVIHEKHNGSDITGYEVINATYNEEYNTITFKTKSFSNYAIAVKESNKTTITNPLTLDNIYKYIVLLIISFISINILLYKLIKNN